MTDEASAASAAYSMAANQGTSTPILNPLELRFGMTGRVQVVDRRRPTLYPLSRGAPFGGLHEAFLADAVQPELLVVAE